MSKYSDSIYFRLNAYIEANLRGQTEKGGSFDPDRNIIPPKEQYVTDTDTQDDFAFPFLTPGGQFPEGLSPWDSSNQTYNNVPVGTYTFIEPQRNDNPWELAGQVTYSFWHGSVDKLLEMKNFLVDLLGRQDWSASDVNYFYRKDNTFPFDFKEVNVMSVTGPIAPEDEGGRYCIVMSVYVSAVYEGSGRYDDYTGIINIGMLD